MITEQKAEQVGGSNALAQNFIKVLIRAAGKNTVAGDACIVYQDIHPAEVLQHFFRKKTHVLFHPRITRHAEMAFSRQFFQQGGRFLMLHIQHRHACACCGASLRNGAANAAGSARHDHGTSGKINIHHGQIVPCRRRMSIGAFRHAALSACTSHSGKSPWRGKEEGNGSQHPSPR